MMNRRFSEKVIFSTEYNLQGKIYSRLDFSSELFRLYLENLKMIQNL